MVMKIRNADKRIILTDEQVKAMQENGLKRSDVYNRIFGLNWTIDKAVSKPVRGRKHGN
ncbi:hypothetical protein JL804_05770 [Staphylococcus pseudintermedius]|nr:hypothetical protein [Staphylococcus pseudintermedius]MCE5606102.1 hypothetical protein [Staphylococcus pseudintermedius]MCE5608599.1 hypothetical protein [Staphylococcus pseudintermedius]MCE5614521.1 hypothetical protein [Staphylococcus pseudintermedius]MCE5707808.1 hypothetical protein [Staphylococcus pseudintermedius]